MKPVRLYYWVVRNPEGMPETHILTGIVTGHPRKKDGTEVQTTYISAVNGRLITTVSGTVYKLGRIHPKYRRWLKKEGTPLDKQNPIKIVTRTEDMIDYKKGRFFFQN